MSKIEVNQIGPQCGTTLTVGCGAGQTVNIDANTVTLGRCGATVSLAAGATQSGFGRTGTVDWDTTAKTASFTAVSGNGYFVNTTSGAITVTLPATPSAGDIVSIADYTNTFQTNAVTVERNGSPIGGISANAALSTEGQSVTFIYVDGTEGWKNVQDSTSNVTGNPFMVATGGTITTCGNYKIHTFTGPGTFTVTGTAICSADNEVDYLVVAGGAGGSGGGPGANTNGGGGGGAGGYRESSGTASGCYSASPLGACVSALPVTATAYPITVGGGGTPGPVSNPSVGGNGSNSVFSTIISAGGGGGGCGSSDSPTNSNPGGPGGSGGGGGWALPSPVTIPGGTGNTPPVNPPQGQPGGNSTTPNGGGGGGAICAGTNSGADPSFGGPGGDGATSSINASPTTRAGGGGGGRWSTGTAASGGAGGVVQAVAES
jgi:hypothetical protein